MNLPWRGNFVKIKLSLYLYLSCFVWLPSIKAFAPSNFFRVNDPFFLQKETKPGFLNTTFHAEGGSSHSGRASTGSHVNILNMYNQYESVIPMLRNPTPTIGAQGVDALLNQLRNLPGGAVTALTRGLVQFTGNFSQLEGGLHACYSWASERIPGEFSISIHQPFLVKRINNFCTNDLTPNFYCADIKVQNFVKDLVGQLKKMGGLSLGNWQASGFGDTIAELEWRKKFNNISNATDASIIKMVTIYAKMGVLFPLAPQKNEDIILSMPLGHDGHWGIPGGAGIEVNFSKYVNVGLFVDFVTLLEKSRNRRLKTDISQTNFLLLNKGFAKKDPGFTWQFEGFLQLFETTNNFNGKIMYQVIKHNNDRLFTQNSFFDNKIINTAPDLQNWFVHNMIFSVGQEYPSYYCKPAISFFYKLPVGGEHVIDHYTFGGQLQLTF